MCQFPHRLQICIGFSLSFLVLQIATLYAPYKRLGPLLVVLSSLTNDIFAFFSIFFVVLLSYGAVLYSMLYPLDDFNGTNIVSPLTLFCYLT